MPRKYRRNVIDFFPAETLPLDYACDAYVSKKCGDYLVLPCRLGCVWDRRECARNAKPQGILIHHKRITVFWPACHEKISPAESANVWQLGTFYMGKPKPLSYLQKAIPSVEMVESDFYQPAKYVFDDCGGSPLLWSKALICAAGIGKYWLNLTYLKRYYEKHSKRRCDCGNQIVPLMPPVKSFRVSPDPPFKITQQRTWFCSSKCARNFKTNAFLNHYEAYRCQREKESDQKQELKRLRKMKQILGRTKTAIRKGNHEAYQSLHEGWQLLQTSPAS